MLLEELDQVNQKINALLIENMTLEFGLRMKKFEILSFKDSLICTIY